MTDLNNDSAEFEGDLAVDQLCDQFETELRDGGKPKIEAYLSKIDSNLETRLFEELLLLELEFLSEHPDRNEYAARFPDLSKLIKRVFDQRNLVDWQGKQIGPFEIVNELGRGGTGVVYLATDSRLDRKVAIKMLNCERRSESRWMRRFRQEARLASNLNHPNIVTIHEIGEDNGLIYLVSEFVPGETLRQKVETRPLSRIEVVEIATQIARGMSFAHSTGVIHRDLKPDNLMLRKDGLLKILDFGLAKDDRKPDDVESRTGVITGSVPFMSPEQARGQRLSSATDIFSFGTTLFFLLTGQLPFRGETPSDVLVSILEREPNDLTEFGIDPQFQRLVTGCLQKVPDVRPSFTEILDFLSQINDQQVFEAAATECDEFVLASLQSTLDSTSEQPLTKVDINDALTPSPIRYAQSGDVNIAWQEIGSGPIDIVFVMGWVSHLEWFWKDPSFSKFLRRLATFARVILFDKRGTGLSDKVPVNELPELETRMDDVRAVMEAANSEQAVLCGVSEGGPLCSLFAATFPDKTTALVMIGSYSRRLWAKDYPWGPTLEQREVFLEEIAANWGGPLGLKERAPSEFGNPRFSDWWASYLRMGASPGAAVALTKMNAQIDIRPVLKSIHVPTLVIHRTGDKCLRVEEGRYLAENIQGARFVELSGDDHLPFVGDADSILDEIELFLTGLTGGEQTDHVLATVLSIRVSDSVDPQNRESFRQTIQEKVELFQGKHAFDGASWLATFDGPVRSILCSQVILRMARIKSLRIGIGLETGTCQIQDGTVTGPAVDESQRLSNIARGESKIVISPTLRNLISGSKFTFHSFESELSDTNLFFLDG